MDRLSLLGALRRLRANLLRIFRVERTSRRLATHVARPCKVSTAAVCALLCTSCGESPAPLSAESSWQSPPGILRVVATDDMAPLPGVLGGTRIELQEFLDSSTSPMPVRLPPVEEDISPTQQASDLNDATLSRLPAVAVESSSSPDVTPDLSETESLPPEIPPLSPDRYSDYAAESAQPMADSRAAPPQLELTAPQTAPSADDLPEIALDDSALSDEATEDSPAATSPAEDVRPPATEADATSLTSLPAEPPTATTAEVRPLPVVTDETPAAIQSPPEQTVESRPRVVRRPAGMHAVAKQAAGHVRHGFSLANRGAMYSARDEFVSALRLISQALDTTTTDRVHSQALARGLRALRESDDFVPNGTRLEADLNIPAIVAAHRTTALHGADPESLSALSARRAYYTYAQEQLALAAGQERSGSMALYGLARINSALAATNPDRHATSMPKAMALHQAALAVDRQNYMAANELAVLLVQHSQFEPARALLEHSVASVPQPAAWHNLSYVYAQLGRPADAEYAVAQATRLARQVPADAGPTASRPPVEWTTPQQFARTTQPHQPQSTAQNSTSPTSTR